MFFCRDKGTLTGGLVIHADDVITGGGGERYERIIQTLTARLPFRKWKIGEGEFCGAQLRQDEGFHIHVSQEAFARGMRLIPISRAAADERELSPNEVSRCRKSLGEGNWLQSQTRMDLSVQVNMAQQQMGHPTGAGGSP